MAQTTFGIIKPDAVRNGKADEIIAVIESNGFTIVAKQEVQVRRPCVSRLLLRLDLVGRFDWRWWSADRPVAAVPEQRQARGSLRQRSAAVAGCLTPGAGATS